MILIKNNFKDNFKLKRRKEIGIKSNEMKFLTKIKIKQYCVSIFLLKKRRKRVTLYLKN